ncbi:MAG: hypothetical protein JST11_11930 [Acidobacteria bacterium]|nr:hypothetical protein [Acidobacteriota bacterium]
MRGLRAWILAALLLPPGVAHATWTVARTRNFEVYSNAPADVPRALASGLERLRAFLARQIGIVPPGTVRVVCFASLSEFDDYRIRPAADGFSVMGPDGEYIVLHAAAPNDLRVPAHEYAHLLIHSSGWNLPGWLAEGIAEVVSTVRFGEQYSFIGGDLPGRSHQLKTAAWIPPGELFGSRSALENDPLRLPFYYAESWAVAETLIVSPRYAPHFPEFLAMLNQGSSSAAAIEGVYHTTADALFREARERVLSGMVPLPLPPVEDGAAAVRVDAASPFEARLALAGLRHASGQAERALAQYRELAVENPRDPRVPAALGVIALERSDETEAARQWERAFTLGLDDADLCYRFAILADDKGLAPAEVRAALERAVALRPDLDDAQFRLGLMDYNADHPADALAHFRAMRPPSPDRAWRYYNALASALLELNRRAEAKQAAIEAERAAASDQERKRARDLQYFADTRLSVEIARGPDGQRIFRAVRVPVDAAPRNPFIEAGDDARSAEARLEIVECNDDGIRLVLGTAAGRLTLAIPDPSKVQIRNAGGVKFEFVCGPQRDRPVLVEYTAAGILRGLELRE